MTDTERLTLAIKALERIWETSKLDPLMEASSELVARACGQIAREALEAITPKAPHQFEVAPNTCFCVHCGEYREPAHKESR